MTPSPYPVPFKSAHLRANIVKVLLIIGAIAAAISLITGRLFTQPGRGKLFHSLRQFGDSLSRCSRGMAKEWDTRGDDAGLN